MKEIKGKTGETEMQPAEYVPDGPVRMPETEPDSRPMVNRSDGSPSAKAPERPIYVKPSRQDEPDARLLKRIEVLETQVKSLQLSMPRSIPVASVEQIEKAK